MALPTVHIRKEAFLVSVWSAVETFKKECLGFFLGRLPTEKNHFYFISDVVPFQRVKRYNVYSELYDTADRRFKNFVASIISVYPKYLGFFHSHPEWGGCMPPDGMSNWDLEKFGKTAEPLEFIIKISPRKREQTLWEALPDGSVGGSYGAFNLHFSIYTLIEEDKEISPLKLQIVVPSAIKTLNRICAKK